MLALRRLALFLAVLLLVPGGIAGAQLLRPLEPPADGIVQYFIAPPLEQAAARPGDEDLAAWAFE